MSLTWSRSRWLMALCCFSFLPLLISMPATARLQEEAKPVAVRVAPEAPEWASRCRCSLPRTRTPR